MLSLASNISATQAVEAKYSAVFDGTDDKIDCGASTNVIANGASEASVMFWVKTTETATQYFFSIKRGAASSAFAARTSSGKIEGVIRGSTGHTFPKSTTSINDGNWHHVAITGKASEQKIYVDGSLEDTHTDTFNMDTTTDTFLIGDHNGSTFIEMTLFEFAVFNTVLDQDNITAAYNGGKEFNLTFNQGNYNSSSNLTAYYKMGDGSFDDKANGIVHNQDNPGFGNNLLSGNDSTFDGSNNWVEYSSSGTTGLSTGSGILTVTLSGESSTTDSGVQISNTHLGISSAGFTYYVEADVWLGTATATDFRIWMGYDNFAISPTTTRTTFRGYITTTNTGTLKIYENTTGGDSGTFFIDNVSVKKLNGNPGVTSGGVTFSSDNP